MQTPFGLGAVPAKTYSEGGLYDHGGGSIYNPPPPPASPGYILQENGGRIQLENSDGYLLLES